MFSLNLWTQIFIYLIFKCMLILSWQNTVSALQNVMLITNLLSTIVTGIFDGNAEIVCYSLVYLSELSAKKCSVGTLRKEQYMSSITKLGKNVVQCCREHGAVYVVFLANCRLVVELVLMRAPMHLWLQVAQELLNVKMLIFSVRKWCIRPFSVSRRCRRKSI